MSVLRVFTLPGTQIRLPYSNAILEAWLEFQGAGINLKKNMCVEKCYDFGPEFDVWLMLEKNGKAHTINIWTMDNMDNILELPFNGKFLVALLVTEGI